MNCFQASAAPAAEPSARLIAESAYKLEPSKLNLWPKYPEPKSSFLRRSAGEHQFIGHMQIASQTADSPTKKRLQPYPITNYKARVDT